MVGSLLVLLAAGLALVNGECTADHCASEFQACWSLNDCREALMCMAKCGLNNPDCGYQCGYWNGGLPIQPLLQCQVDNHCVPDPAPTAGGKCIGTDDDADKRFNTVDDLAGDWWVVKGKNCGDTGLGFDSLPCMKQSIVKGQSTGKSTYTYGPTTSKFSPEYITIYNEYKMEAPGVLTVTDKTNNLVKQQVSRQRFLTVVDGKYALLSSCVTSPLVNVNSLMVVSKKRNFDEIPAEAVEKLRETAAKFGIDLDNDMCTVNNSKCEN